MRPRRSIVGLICLFVSVLGAATVTVAQTPLASSGESDIFVAKYSAPPATLEPVAPKIEGSQS